MAAAVADNGLDVRLSTVIDGLVTAFLTSITTPVTAIFSLLMAKTPLEPDAKLSHCLPADASTALAAAAPPPLAPLDVDAAAASAAAAALVVKLKVPFFTQLPLKSHMVTLK